MSLSLVTGYAGKPHVKSSQDGAFNAAVYGTGKYVFDIGNQFTHEIISNNIVRVKDGYALNQGRFMGMETGDYEDVTIDNGLQGVKRSDLIAMRYTLNPDTGIETAELVVIKGTSGDVYSDPESIEGNILNGASEDDFLLYRVKIDGINIVAVEPLFTVSSSAMMMINTVEKKVDDAKDSVVSFTSADNKKPTEWTDVSVLAGGEKHSSLFNKISTMFKNIRWLYKMLGTTDISAIGGGTVTGAISALNTNLKNKITGQSNNIVIYGGTWVLHGVSNQIYTNEIDISNLGLSSVISVIAQPENYPSLIHVAVSIVSAKLLNVQTFKDTTGDFAAHFIIIGTK